MGIIDFILSANIRSGEYETNVHIIKNVDQSNFLIFTEYVYPCISDEINISNAFAINQKDLLGAINKHAQKQGLNVDRQIV